MAPVFNTSANIVAAAADKSAGLFGTSAVYRTLNNLTIDTGRFIDDGDVHDGAAVMVLGSNLANSLFGKGQAVAVGDRVRAHGRDPRAGQDDPHQIERVGRA